ncbi:MAG: hypothetical protein RBS22_09525 [Spongiibacteraceae bacterium]|nr:hypothetical protein [Spongiibacteraceae bacterium]
MATDLKPLLVEAPTDLRQMQWYGHRVQVLRRKCVILMELQSRYAMVFAGLTKPDFLRFPELVRDRLWREIVSICALDDAESQRLAALVDVVSQPVQIVAGSDRSVQAHMKEVAWHLEWMANDFGSLPLEGGDAFAFGLRVNQTPRSRKGQKEYFWPIEVMREFWLGMLAHATPRADNVVPFRRPR